MDVGIWNNTNEILNSISTYSGACILIGIAILIVVCVLLSKVNLIIRNQEKILKRLKPTDEPDAQSPQKGTEDEKKQNKRGKIFF